jgi:hypothetical protein
MVDCIASAWFCTLSVLQVKPRCPLDGSAPWVAPSLSVVSRCASVWFYYLVCVSGATNYYLPHYGMHTGRPAPKKSVNRSVQPE